MFKLNPLEIVQAVKSIRKSRNESAHKYIESVAIEADELANIWHEIVTSIINGNNIDKDKLVELGAHKYIPRNASPYSKIHNFYSSVSKSIGYYGKNHLVDEVAYRIGTILVDRDNANNLFTKLLDNVNNDAYFSELNHDSVLTDLSSSVTALRNEASALLSLAKTIEANNY